MAVLNSNISVVIVNVSALSIPIKRYFKLDFKNDPIIFCVKDKYLRTRHIVRKLKKKHKKWRNTMQILSIRKMKW